MQSAPEGLHPTRQNLHSPEIYAWHPLQLEKAAAAAACRVQAGRQGEAAEQGGAVGLPRVSDRALVSWSQRLSHEGPGGPAP